MKKSEFVRQLEEMVDAPPGSFKETHKLADVGWESLSVLEFQSLVEVEFQSKVSLDQLVACATVGDLVALVKDKLTELSD